MSQLSYPANMPVAKLGMLADLGLDKQINTGHNSTLKLYCGRFVTYGGGADLVKHPTAAGDITNAALAGLGGVVVDAMVFERDSEDDMGYPAKSPASILKRGRIWVYVEAAIVVGTSGVYVRHTADAGLTVIGGFAPAAGTGLALLANAKWIVGASAAGMAQLEVDL